VTDRRIRDAIEASDLNDLLRIVDGQCKARRWDALLDLRHLLREAVTRGKQVWGVDEHIRYRLALEGPPDLAAGAVMEGPARFALGPLTEVAANRHTFSELDTYLPPGPERSLIAHERVIAGEEIDAGSIDPRVLDLPLALLSWEPAYSRPQYKPDRVESHPPDVPRMEAVDLPDAPPQVDDPETTSALLSLVAPWVEESNGRAQVSCVEGSALEAIRALGPAKARVAPVEAELAVGAMAWAAASGGALGKRRGGASGRFSAWWAIASLGDLEWPASPEHVGEAAGHMHWLAWSDLAPPTGWNLNLAIEDRREGLAWALSALDSV
jgi:hypothetical protein